MRYLFFPILFTAFVLYSCATTEADGPAASENTDGSESALINDSTPGSVNVENMNDLERTLYANRSELKDQFTSLSHDLPESYLMEIDINEEVDMYAGFRVQILSTRNVVLADSIRNEFTIWADSAFVQYIPRADIYYRQPFYRVRVGDFHDQSRAISLSSMIKSKYPDAWVVHDQVIPENVPADTTTVSLK